MDTLTKDETLPEGGTPGNTGEDAPKGKKAKAPRKRKKLTLGQRIANLFLKIAVLVLVIWLLVTKIGGVFICHTSDMFPSLRDGDLLITYRLGTYRTGDIIAYRHDGDTLFGRIVAEPGDEIYMDEEGNFTVNGTAPYETIFYRTEAREMSPVTYPFTVKEGEIFVLSDAREEGLDSRALGPTTEPMGKVVLQLRRRGF